MTAPLPHIPTIETERLRLRAPQASDFEAYAAFGVSDRARTTGGPYTRDQSFNRLCALLGHWQIRGFGRWMIADRTTDQPLGVSGLHFPDGWPEPEIAWTVFGPAEGQGIAHEAAQAVRRHAYGTLGWTTVMSAVDPSNTRSVALARRMGCWPEGTFDHPTYGVLHIWRHPGPASLGSSGHGERAMA